MFVKCVYDQARLDNYKAVTGKDKLSNDHAKKHVINAVQMADAIQCKRQCLEAQIDAHFKCVGKELKTDAGVGGGTKKEIPRE